MLGSAPIAANVGVKDLAKAKEFYGKTLELDKLMENDGGVVYKSGEGTMLFVYETPNGGTNKATTASWKVDDLESEMKELKSKGIEFEDYDMPGLKTENGVASWDGDKAAWFKDPDGNIFCINEFSEK